MTALYNPERHTALTTEPWSAQLAIDEIHGLLDDIANAQQTDRGWPLHPLDAESYPTPDTKWALYAGAAGVVIGTEILRKAGYPAPDLRADLPTIHQNYLLNPDVGAVEPGLQLGEIGILTQAILGNPKNEDLSARADWCMSGMIDHPAHEITSGQTGMMLAALALYRATGEDRWKSHFQNGAEALWSNWDEASDGSGWFWENRIFDQNRSYLGACHGIAGNMSVLLQGADLLPAPLVAEALERTATTLVANVRRASNMANWHASAPPIEGKLFVQWCHGAAGIVTALGASPNDVAHASTVMEALLAEASALVWHAGPLAKGPGICHGTAGNGYAFLAMYKRDSQQIWLDRARAFASHAIQQSRQDRARFGQARFSLMTGDAGLSVYLHHCLYPQAAGLPGHELFA